MNKATYYCDALPVIVDPVQEAPVASSSREATIQTTDHVLIG